MIGFLEKLERWVHILDEQLNDTIVQTITGKVFIHNPSAKVTAPQDEVGPEDVGIILLTPSSKRESHKTDIEPYTPVMKKAPASYK